ncbi:hypothetical protein KDW37_06585 [Burkholderia cenocepacia]|uniref:hypothetical protein n=1 Tax=Burkholderia cenocepacia TaxID=95486 RepID=UPI001B8E5038|nr:hypothetical protein [Burkholderia cenocepacia]MBR8430386.1 hypothetical protein [Burkholderia cenocepacia]
MSITWHPVRTPGTERLLHVDSRTRARIRHVSETGAFCMPVFQERPQIQCDTNPLADALRRSPRTTKKGVPRRARLSVTFNFTSPCHVTARAA